MEKKNVLIVTAAYITHGGVEIFLMNWLSQMPKEKYEFTWYYPSNNVDEVFANEFRKMGVKLICGGLDYSVQGIHKINKLRRINQDIKNILVENQFDIIHVNTGGISIEAIALRQAKKKNVCIRIGHSHSADALFASPVKKAACKLIRIIVNACATKRVACSLTAAESLYGKKYVHDTIIINNCINTQRFAFSADTRKAWREKYGIQDCFVIGEIGLLCKDKNQIFLIDVFKNIYEKDHNTRLLLVGSGPDEKKIKQYVHEMGMDKAVIFPGLTDTPENDYCAMDVFVLPSPAEGLPFVGVEAQASGLPCVFSDGVTKEVNLSGSSKFISLNESTQTWAEEILKLRSLDIQKRKQAYEIIEKKHFGMSHLIQMRKLLYEEK